MNTMVVRSRVVTLMIYLFAQFLRRLNVRKLIAIGLLGMSRFVRIVCVCMCLKMGFIVDGIETSMKDNKSNVVFFLVRDEIYTELNINFILE